MPTTKVTKTIEAPSGLIYVPYFLTDTEEQQLLSTLGSLNYHEVVMRGVAARRTVIHYGYDYGYDNWKVFKSDPFPDWLEKLRDRAAPYGELDCAVIEQALIARYPAGATIGWHRDAPPFGPVVIGISLGSDEVMRFRRKTPQGFEMYKQMLARRSLYVLSGAARTTWQHSLAPVSDLRYSITFRTVRNGFKARLEQGA